MDITRHTSLLAALLCGLFAWSGAAGVTLSFAPQTQDIGLGDQVTVDIIVSDLGGSLIGAFDFNVAWDETIVSFDSITFGSFLDGPGLSAQAVVVGAGTINVAEASFGTLAGQDGNTSFALFTLVFNGLNLGVSPLTLSGGISPSFEFLSDGAGNALPTTTMAGEIRVVPVPAGFLLLFSGLTLLGALRRPYYRH